MERCGGRDVASCSGIGLPCAASIILLHDCSRLWYFDKADVVHLLVNDAIVGKSWRVGFLSSRFRSAVRSVLTDYDGNILLSER